MWVTIWRHGEAAPGRIDEYRGLTSRGRQSTQAVTARFKALCDAHAVSAANGVAFSPLVRTTQTAEIVSTALGCDSNCAPILAPGTEPEDYPAFLDEGLEHQVLVSHQPFVSILINYWLDDLEQPPLMPGGFACIDLLAPARGGGQLVFIEPEIF